MSKIKFIMFVLGAFLWITTTSLSFSSLSSVGSIFTYSSGVFSLDLPQEGLVQVKVTGDYEPEIYVDEVGVPHIFGNNKAELSFGLGYMQARERYFQMEMIVRAVKGELSAVFGANTLSSDIWWRPYQFDQKAKEVFVEIQQQNPEVYEYLRAYGAGVKQYLSQESETEQCFEYSFFDLEPMQWEDHYSILVLWYMSKELSYRDHHLVRQDQINKLSPQLLDALFPMKEEALPLIYPDSTATLLSAIEYHKTDTEVTWSIGQLMKEAEEKRGIGSNNWVIDGSRTESGKPILCNDPHLALTLPGIFYEAHLILPDQNMYGFTITSSPFLVIGHNEDIAWGMTNGEWDLTERTLLNVDPQNPTRYRNGDSWKAFDVQDYKIEVKGGNTHDLKFQSSDFGKVIREPDGKYYAQKWFPEAKHKSFIALIKFLDAENWDGFKEALQHYEYPPQNFAFQDKEGNIGMITAGKMPLKPEGFAGGLMKPLDMQKEAFIPFEEWPTASNPERGFLFSANQEPIRNGNYYNYNWMSNNYRAKRIFEFLEADDKISMQDVIALQKDNKDLAALEVKALLAKHFDENTDNFIIQQLLTYDGKVDGTSTKSLLAKFYPQGIQLELEYLLQKYANLKQRPSIAAALQYLNASDEVVLQDTTFLVKDILQRVAEDTEYFVKSRFKEDYPEVAFDEVGKFEIPHIARVPGLGVKINSFAGNENTVNVSSAAHASLRFIVSFDQDEQVNSKVIVAGGQSGRVNSPNYKDQIIRWQNNEYRTPQLTTNKSELKNIKTKIVFQNKK